MKPITFFAMLSPVRVQSDAMRPPRVHIDRHPPVLSELRGVAAAAPAWAAPRIKVLKLSVTNPTDQHRLHDNIVISVSELRRIAPDFRAGDAIVTTSDAATLEEDARTVQVTELPSQADDLDGDGKYDELQVETRFLRGPRAYEVTGIPFHEDNQTVIKERFYLDKADPNTLFDEVMVIDNAMTRPYTKLQTGFRNPDPQPVWKSDVCSENNAQIRGTMRS